MKAVPPIGKQTRKETRWESFRTFHWVLTFRSWKMALWAELRQLRIAGQRVLTNRL